MKLKVFLDQGWVDPAFAALLKHISYMYSTEDNEGLKDDDGSILKNSSDTISRVFEAMSKAACEELNMNWAFIPPPETKCN